MVGMWKRLAVPKRDLRHDWAIDDVETVCRSFELDCHQPSKGSHCIVSHARIDGLLTVPATHPIKPIHIMLLVEMIESLEQL